MQVKQTGSQRLGIFPSSMPGKLWSQAVLTGLKQGPWLSVRGEGSCRQGKGGLATRESQPGAAAEPIELPVTSFLLLFLLWPKVGDVHILSQVTVPPHRKALSMSWPRNWSHYSTQVLSAAYQPTRGACSGKLPLLSEPFTSPWPLQMPRPSTPRSQQTSSHC